MQIHLIFVVEMFLWCNQIIFQGHVCAEIIVKFVQIAEQVSFVALLLQG